MFTGLMRTLILYILIIAGVRLMGKRQVGELEPSELVLSLIIADLASVPMQDYGIPLLAGVVLLYTSHNILMSFPYQIVQYLGGGSGEMGTLLTLQSLMDIPAMVLFSLLLRRAASWRWVRLAGLSFFLHALLTWLAPSVFFLYGIQIFETTGYALYAVASVYWVNDMTAPADRVQGQTYFTMANTLGIVLSSFLGGFLLDAAGTGPTLAFSTVTGGTGMGILWIMLR